MRFNDRSSRWCVEVHFEAASVIASLTMFGQILELTVRSRISAAIKALLGPSTTTARRIAGDGFDADVPLAEARVSGTALRTGEKIPVDGIVIRHE